MSISFVINELPNREIAQAVESTIREYIGDQEEDWVVRIEAGSSYCRVTLEGPKPRRQQYFFDDPPDLPAKISAWLRLYSLG